MGFGRNLSFKRLRGLGGITQFQYSPSERQEFFDSTQKLPVTRRGVMKSMDAYLLK